MREKKTAPPPRNGSKYAVGRSDSTIGMMIGTSHLFPPGHRKNGCGESCRESVTRHCITRGLIGLTPELEDVEGAGALWFASFARRHHKREDAGILFMDLRGKTFAAVPIDANVNFF